MIDDGLPRISPPAVTGGKALYLDLDGVLYPEDVRMRPRKGPYIASPPGHELFEHAVLLADVLAPYPDVNIVLSTSWVSVYGSCTKVAKRLPDCLRARIVGATYHSAMDGILFGQAPRGMQVWSDVLRRKPSAWLAIDDDYLHWPPWCRDHLVRTDEIRGISEPTVFEELKSKLAAMEMGHQ